MHEYRMHMAQIIPHKHTDRPQAILACRHQTGGWSLCRPNLYRCCLVRMASGVHRLGDWLGRNGPWRSTQLRRASLVDLHVLVTNLDRVVVATFDLVVNVEFCNSITLVLIIRSQSTPLNHLHRKSTHTPLRSFVTILPGALHDVVA